MLDVENMTVAMMEYMRDRVSLADGVRMDKEQFRRWDQRLEADDLWPRGRHAYVREAISYDYSPLMTVGAMHRRLHTAHTPVCKHCSYEPRHAA